MELRGKKALVTGATGFIGGRLAERLQTEAGVCVRALVRNPAKAQRLADLGVEIVPGDITQPASLPAAVADCHLVFHAAAYVNEGIGRKAAVWAVNVTGTENMVNAAVAAGVERFIHISSCAVYGSLQRHQIDEQTPTRLRGHLYGDSKVMAEEIVFRAYRKQGLAVVAARASHVYGPGSQLTIRPIQAIKAGKLILIDGGRYLCKPIYIDDLVDGLILCATTESAGGQAINFTNDAPVPWRGYFGAYGQMLQVNSFPSVPFAVAWMLACFYEIKAILTGHRASLNRELVKFLHSDSSFSNQKARTLLGWKPQVTFSEGMHRTETWLRAEGYLNR
ncbi:MAG: NAD-dependent epimerase/dehydratase family protein [Chloroflexi bacterium]|nr:NAD-dependent epimerase/dehydratase family protein [Chloroflexota bacterium]